MPIGNLNAATGGGAALPTQRVQAAGYSAGYSPSNNQQIVNPPQVRLV